MLYRPKNSENIYASVKDLETIEICEMVAVIVCFFILSMFPVLCIWGLVEDILTSEFKRELKVVIEK